MPLKETLERLVTQYGLRPVIDALADAVENMDVVLYDTADNSQLDDEDVAMAADNLRAPLF